jgi:hypothetical protein
MENKAVYPVKFRWNLGSKSLPEFSSYVTNCQHDYYSKTVGAVVLDALVKGKPVVHEWIIKTLRNPDDEVLTISQFDGNGNLLYKKVMKGVKIVGHKCNYNYDCDGDDLQDHELVFTYDKLETIDNVN